MSLIVETGSGSSTAESYVSVTEADTYHSNFGNTDWSGADSVKEPHLRKATRAIDRLFHSVWKGYRVSKEQALDFPRYAVEIDGFVQDSDVIPTILKEATYEAALLSIQGTDILSDLDSDAPVEAEMVKIGPITVSNKFGGGGKTADTFYRKVFLAIEELIENNSDKLVLA